MNTHQPTQTDQPTNRERFEATLRERGCPETVIAAHADLYYPRKPK